MAKYYRKKIKPQLNTNYKLFGYIGSWLDDIESRLDNLSWDGLKDTLESTIAKIYKYINDINNSLKLSIQTEGETRKTNDDFLQNQINTEIQDRKDGDTALETSINDETKAREKADKAINDRLNNMQFMKWFRYDDFGDKTDDFNMVLGEEDWEATYDFPDQKYTYKNTFIVSAKILYGDNDSYDNVSDYGVFLTIVRGENNNTQLKVIYRHELNNYPVNNSRNTIMLYYTQFYNGAEPDPMPY